MEYEHDNKASTRQVKPSSIRLMAGHEMLVEQPGRQLLYAEYLRLSHCLESQASVRYPKARNFLEEHRTHQMHYLRGSKKSVINKTTHT